MSDEQILPATEDEPENEAAADELTDDELDEIAGGTDPITPRDPASGLATGKRSYGAITG